MSLQRHAWAWIGSADAKPMNSVLHGSVLEAQIQQDLLNVGDMMVQRVGGNDVGGVTTHRPSLHDQVLAIGRLGALPAAGQGLVAAVAGEINTAVATNMFGDYTVRSGRTYRVDNTAIDFMNAANHCYPIAGPGLWAGMDQTTFAGASSFRRLEQVVASKQGKSAHEIWRSLENDPTSRNTPIYGAFTGARTQYQAMSAATRALLVAASGETQAAISVKQWLDS
jgi:hypothetical protein